MSVRLYNRQVELTIAKPLNGSFSETEPNASIIRGLRVGFSIEKHVGSEPNTSTITVWNLAEQTRALVEKKPLYIRLEAGYGDDLQRIFSGDLRWSQSLRERGDWETTLELGDGDRAFRFARVNRSYRGGVKASTVVDECARSMGLELVISAQAQKALRAEYASGAALSGPARSTLTTTLNAHGLAWSIQDGQLLIQTPAETRVNEAVVISQATGMIGSPEYGTPTEKGGKPVLRVRTLLEPRILAGGRVKVESRSIDSLFRVERVIHSGDTHGEDWYTDIEAKAA